MKRKTTAVIMIMLLVFGMMTMTGCGRNDGVNDLSQTPNNAEDNLNNDNGMNNRDEGLAEDLRDGADDLGDDIRDGADDIRDDLDDALDGEDNRTGDNTKNNMTN